MSDNNSALISQGKESIEKGLEFLELSKIVLKDKDLDLADYIAKRKEIIANTERRGKMSSENKRLLKVVRHKMQKYISEIDNLLAKFLD